MTTGIQMRSGPLLLLESALAEARSSAWRQGVVSRGGSGALREQDSDAADSYCRPLSKGGIPLFLQRPESPPAWSKLELTLANSMHVSAHEGEQPHEKSMPCRRVVTKRGEPRDKRKGQDLLLAAWARQARGTWTLCVRTRRSERRHFRKISGQIGFNANLRVLLQDG
jgi:hypothetical protein